MYELNNKRMSFGGLDGNLRYYEFEVDSAAADYGMSSLSSVRDWPLFKLGGKKPLENIAGIKILEAEIPFSWYIFNSENNTFLLTETGFGPVTVTIPIGNYTVGQITAILSTSLSNVSPSGFDYFVVFESNIQKFLYSNASTDNLPFSFTFGSDGDAGDSNPRNFLGFPAGTTGSQSFVGGGAGNLLSSPYVLSITGPNYLFINSFKMGNLTDLYVPLTSDTLTRGNSGPQMAKVPVTVQPGGTIYWQDPCPTMFFDLENLNSLTEIDFFLSLGNSSQVPLQLNGQSFSLKIGVLVNEFTNSSVSSGTLANGRVMNRISKR